MTILSEGVSLKQSAIGDVQFLIVDGTNCGIVDPWDIVLRLPISESRLAAIKAVVGIRRCCGKHWSSRKRIHAAWRTHTETYWS
jgi:hypothetical protein